jgi:iron complex transport system ATP-binding protein
VLRAEALVVVAQRRRLLDGVDVVVRPGECVAVVGPNGAGKSTLAKALAGEIVAAHGTVSLDGRPLREWEPRELARRRAVMPQDTAVSFAFTAREIVLLGRYPHCGGRPGRIDHAIACDALDLADARAFADQPVTTLSGGERARVQLARAIAQVLGPCAAPRYLLLDEPVASLDLKHQHAALRVTRELARERGVGVLAIVHDLNLALRYADRVVLLHEGRVVADDAPARALIPFNVERCFDVAIDLAGPSGSTPSLIVVRERGDERAAT